VSATIHCLRHAWERRADEDTGLERLRFRCSRCGVAGSKKLGQPDAAVTELGVFARKADVARRGEELARARDRREREDEGYHADHTDRQATYHRGLPWT
jgi:hypothetical protein